ncbi:hypothetical protein V8G54_024018 [Vigna mungo]|uniref:Uncharacterized protein n=1 Tax=Vigna mungo TaxID=3915 RepID=A0AAQ3RQX1_VIGMU
MALIALINFSRISSQNIFLITLIIFPPILTVVAVRMLSCCFQPFGLVVPTCLPFGQLALLLSTVRSTCPLYSTVRSPSLSLLYLLLLLICFPTLTTTSLLIP